MGRKNCLLISRFHEGCRKYEIHGGEGLDGQWAKCVRAPLAFGTLKQESLLCSVMLERTDLPELEELTWGPVEPALVVAGRRQG